MLIGNFWMLAAMVVAVHEAVEFESTGRVVGVFFIEWLVLILFQILLFMEFGLPRPRNG